MTDRNSGTGKTAEPGERPSGQCTTAYRLVLSFFFSSRCLVRRFPFRSPGSGVEQCDVTDEIRLRRTDVVASAALAHQGTVAALTAAAATATATACLL